MAPAKQFQKTLRNPFLQEVKSLSEIEGGDPFRIQIQQFTPDFINLIHPDLEVTNPVAAGHAAGLEGDGGILLLKQQVDRLIGSGHRDQIKVLCQAIMLGFFKLHADQEYARWG